MSKHYKQVGNYDALKKQGGAMKDVKDDMVECPKCHGEGVVHNGELLVECPKCKGDGVVRG